MSNTDTYERVTNHILDLLKKGVVPWKLPWTHSAPVNLVTGKRYRGANVLVLRSAGFESPYWLTYKQAQNLGGFVKRGEQGCPITFWNQIEAPKEDGTEEKKVVLQHKAVFNIAQVEGVDAPSVSTESTFAPISSCDEIVTSYKNRPAIVHGGQQAWYSPAQDLIKMPQQEAFSSSAAYYSTLFHELVHSTGAEHRLKRGGVVDATRFASHEYAFEELVAEIGAAYLAARAGIDANTTPSSAAYIASWMDRLNNNPRWFVMAAAIASSAANFICDKNDIGKPESDEVAA